MRVLVFMGYLALFPAGYLVVVFWIMVNLDIVTSRYSTYEDAVADHLFQRGWLPHFIPASATDIVTRNNLDLDLSEGEFRYDPAETGAFLANLHPWRADETSTDAYAAHVKEMAADGYHAWELENADGLRVDINRGTVWVFFVNAPEGHAIYESWLYPDLR